MWRDDVREWQKEQAKLLAELEIALGASNTMLSHHTTAIGELEETIAHHEHFIAECARSLGERGGDVKTALTEAHRKEAAAHATIRELHERIKRHHHRSMAKLALVRRLSKRGV